MIRTKTLLVYLLGPFEEGFSYSWNLVQILGIWVYYSKSPFRLPGPPPAFDFLGVSGTGMAIGCVCPNLSPTLNEAGGTTLLTCTLGPEPAQPVVILWYFKGI